MLVGCLVYYGMHWLGWGPGLGGEGSIAVAGASGRACRCRSRNGWPGSRARGARRCGYLPVAMPLALATVVGGIDCTESAAAAGDDYPTGQIIAAEGLGHALRGPVRRRDPVDALHRPSRLQGDGGRGRLTRWRRRCSSVRRGSSAIFDWIFFLIPKAVIFPILIFVGLEITAQSFHATPRPALSRGGPGVRAGAGVSGGAGARTRSCPSWASRSRELAPPTQHWIQTVTVLAGGGGFIVTSLLWATALAHLIDGRVRPVVATLLLRGRFFLVWHHSFAACRRARSRCPGAVIAQLEADGRARGDGLADTLSLGGRLRSHGGGACWLRTDSGNAGPRQRAGVILAIAAVKPIMRRERRADDVSCPGAASEI